jgi:hypothetical protein
MITRDNYESFFLDFIEGRLDASQMEDVKLFLLSHPDLAAELEDISGFTLEADDDASISKLELYRHPAPEEAPIFPPVAHAIPQDQLKPVRLPRLEAPFIEFAAKEELRRQLASVHWNLLPGWGARRYQKPSVAAFHNTSCIGALPKLIAPTIIFEDKASLKRKEAIMASIAPAAQGARVVSMKRVFSYSAAAAAIAALVWFNFQTPTNSSMADGAINDERPINQPDKKDNSISPNNNAPDNNQEAQENEKSNIILPKYIKSFDAAPDQGEVAENGVIPPDPMPIEVPQDIDAPKQEEQPMPLMPSEIMQSQEEDVAQQVTAPLLENNTNTTAETALPKVVDVNKEPNAFAYTAQSGNSTSYANIWEFAKAKAKEKVWGDKNYPQADFATELLKKEFSKPGSIGDKVDLDTQKSERKKRFSIRIGRYGFSKTKSK